MPDDNQPVLPYGTGENATTGHAGSDASRERAERERDSGAASERQRRVLAHLARYGTQGVTYAELGLRLNLHHGQSSGVLSNLHKAGLIERLAEKRHRCHVYVLREFVNGRETQPAGRVARPGLGPVADEMARLLREMRANDYPNGNEWGQYQDDIGTVLAEYDRIVH